VRLAHITTPQELSSARAQGNCQGINFLIPKASLTKKRRKQGVKGPRSRQPLTLQRLPDHPDNLQIFAWAQATHKCSHTATPSLLHVVRARRQRRICSDHHLVVTSALLHCAPEVLNMRIFALLWLVVGQS